MSTQVPTVKTPQDLGSVNMGGSGGFMPSFKTFEEVYRWCALIASSEMVPKAYRGKPADIMVAVQFGAEVGLKWMQSLQSIATVNGTPSIFGDAALALVRVSGKLAEFDEWIEVNGQRTTDPFPIMTWADDPTKTIVAKCYSKRVGDKEGRTTSFSVDDAKRASLWGKSGPWTGVPQRMLMWRARGWNLRDNFGDVLKGLAIYEESIDVPGPDAVQATIAQQSQPETKGKALTEKLDALTEHRIQEPQDTASPEQPVHEPPAQPAEPQEQGQSPTPGTDVAFARHPEVLATIAEAERILNSSPAGQQAIRKVWGAMKIRTTGTQNPVDVIPDEQVAFYLKQLNLAVDSLANANG